VDTSSPIAQRSSLGLLKRVPVSVVLIAANLTVFAVAELSGSTTSTETLLRFGAVWRGLVWSGDIWRLATAMFLHIGVLHLVWNGWFGFRMCSEAESELGSVPFLLIYLGSGIAGSALSVIGHDAVSAGASGALFGLIGARYLRWRLVLGSWRKLWDDPALRRDLTWVGLWFVLGAYAGFDNYAHFGGLVFGVVGAWAAVSRPRRAPVAVAVALLAAFVLAALRPLPFIHSG
jgi:rhomboid protease GluP